MLRYSLRLLPVLVLALVGVFALTAARPADARERTVRAVHVARVFPSDGGLVRQIHRYRRATWRWQSVMGVPRTPATHAAVKDPSHKYKVWVRNLWKHRAKRARRRAAHPPHKAGWLCIHQPRGRLARSQRPLLRRPPDGSRFPAHLRGPSSCAGRARPTTGLHSSRCGSPSARTAAAGATTRGPTLRATAD